MRICGTVWAPCPYGHWGSSKPEPWNLFLLQKTSQSDSACSQLDDDRAYQPVCSLMQCKNLRRWFQRESTQVRSSRFVSPDLSIPFLWRLEPQYLSRLFMGKDNRNVYLLWRGCVRLSWSPSYGLFYGFVGFLVSKYACMSWNPMELNVPPLFPEWLRRRDWLID